jgi:hypothetical protein
LKNDVNEPSKSNKQNKQKLFFVGVLKVTYEKKQDPELDPDPNPDPLVRGADPRIRIRTKMSQVTVPKVTDVMELMSVQICNNEHCWPRYTNVQCF